LIKKSTIYNRVFDWIVPGHQVNRPSWLGHPGSWLPLFFIKPDPVLVPDQSDPESTCQTNLNFKIIVFSRFKKKKNTRTRSKTHSSYLAYILVQVNDVSALIGDRQTKNSDFKQTEIKDGDISHFKINLYKLWYFSNFFNFKIYLNNIFLFFKNYFWYQQIKII
jgi:hypothetical protein